LLEGCPIVAAGIAIPRRLLLAYGSLGPRLPAAAVARALAAGFAEAGSPEPDLLALDGDAGGKLTASALLDGQGFDARMRAARAVVLAVVSLAPRGLAGSLPFEVATRARQAGVPCYAVVHTNGMDLFDMRMLDLQTVLEGRSAASLQAAGRALAQLA
jgi:glycerate kinase